jgi:1-acyl-sn-glycerol-3-phosphate acyltransferase
MKITIIKWLIGWLMRNYKFLVMDAVIPDGKHIHKNPPRKALRYPVKGE